MDTDRRLEPICVIAIGLSTPFVYWGFDLVCSLVEIMTGPLLRLHISSLEQLRSGIDERTGRSLVITADLPDAELAEFIAKIGVPTVIFSDRASDFFDWARTSRRLEAQETLRFCSHVYSAIAPCLNATPRLVLHGEDDARVQDIVAELLGFLWPQSEAGARPDMAELETKVAAALQDAREAARAASVEARLAKDEADAPPQAFIDASKAALESYGALLKDGFSRMSWPVALFFQRNARRWDAVPLALIGPARALMYGPYLHLPRGPWNARVEFEVDGGVGGLEAVADVRINGVCTERNFHMPETGIFAFDLQFRVANPADIIEVRILLRRAALEGNFLLRSIHVTPA